MKQSISLLKKTLKIILWVIIGYVLLLILIAVLIQIPTIQMKLSNYATSFVSNKTHTKVELKKVNISFPKSIVVEDLYLEDKQKDTLLYAGRAKVNIALFDLLLNKITINSFSLENATLKLYNSKTAPLFNYNFLITAFNDSTSQAKTDTVKSKWTFNLDKVFIKNVRLTYNDDYAGMNASVAIENSELNVSEIDLRKSIYKIDEMFVEGLTANVRQVETHNIQNRDSANIMPAISAKRLQINNSLISYVDSVGYLSVFTNINQCEMKNASIDLQKEFILPNLPSKVGSTAKGYCKSGVITLLQIARKGR